MSEKSTTRVRVHPAWVWAIALLVIPAPFMTMMWAFLGPMYRSMLIPILAGILSFVWMLEVVYLSCRPHWLDRIVGLPHVYLLHGVLGVLALSLAVFHRLELPSFDTAKLTGEIGFWILLAVVVIALVLMAGWVSNSLPVLGWLRRTLERGLRYETTVWFHRVILVALSAVCLHLNLVFYISEVTPFVVLANAATVLVLAWYGWTRICARRGVLGGEVVANEALSGDVTELSLRVASDPGSWDAGDHVAVRFPSRRGMRQYHPFSLVSQPNSAGEMRFAIRADGDFTTAVRNVPVGELVHVTRPFGRYRRFIDEHRPGRPVVFYAGGIGVTPLIPVAQWVHSDGREVTFLYSVKPGEELLYQEELRRLARLGISLKMLVGQFSEDELRAAMRPGALYLIGGPARMRKSVKRLLRRAGVAASDISYEAFEW